MGRISLCCLLIFIGGCLPIKKITIGAPQKPSVLSIGSGAFQLWIGGKKVIDFAAWKLDLRTLTIMIEYEDDVADDLTLTAAAQADEAVATPRVAGTPDQ